MALAEISHVLQLVLGLVFLAAAAQKAHRPSAFIGIVRGFEILPTSLGGVSAIALIAAEAAIAITVLTGWRVLESVALAVLVLAIFLAAVLVTLKRHRRIACGCFGGDEFVSAMSAIRISCLIGVSLAIQLIGAIEPLRTTTTIIATDPSWVSHLASNAFLACFIIVIFVWATHASQLATIARYPSSATRAVLEERG